MLDVGTSFLFHFTNTSFHKKAVCSATLRDSVDGLFTAELWEEDFDLEIGQEFLIYYDIDGKYVKHLARIDLLLPAKSKPMVSFRLIDSPMNAENREDDRVVVRDMGLTADFGNETDCPLIDVSNFGFAVEAKEKYLIASVVSVNLRFNGTQYRGKASVESSAQQIDGRFRYGLRCIENTRVSVSLKAGLQLIKSAFDRKRNLPKTG